MMRTALMILTLAATAAQSGELSEINNFRSYSAQFASSGQPTAAQFKDVADAGFERVVYIAWSDHQHSLPNEDRVVKGLGMEYLHIPVDWQSPTASDFYLFAGAMQRAPQKKTLLHCQVNMRASAFGLLYRVLYEDVALPEAKRDMNSVWHPEGQWLALIRSVLGENGVDADCAGCDWAAPPEQP